MRRRVPTRRREASRAPSQAFIYGLGLLGIVVVVAMFLLGFNAPNSIPGRSYYNLHAQFRFADNVTGHYQVRVSGRLVGQVLNPRVEHGMAVIDLQLTPAIKPLLSDTTVRVRPRSPIGVRFVELTPGQHGQPLPEGATIPATQSSAAAELDTIFNTFDSNRQAKVHSFLNQLGLGAAGRGVDLNDALNRSPAFVAHTGAVASAIVAHAGAAGLLVRASEGAAAAADPVRLSIATGFRPEADALAPFSTHAVTLRATLDEAPATLDTVRVGLAQTTPLLDALRGLAGAAATALPPAPAALNETSALLRTARPGLRGLRSTLDLAKRATAPLLTLLRRVNPVLPALSNTLRTGLPLIKELGARGCDLTLFAKNWDSMLAFGVSGGALGAVNDLRANVILSAESVGGAATSTPRTFAHAYPQPCTVTQDRAGR
jgi:ABC-type transporter Mla subunit MlaD